MVLPLTCYKVVEALQLLPDRCCWQRTFHSPWTSAPFLESICFLPPLTNFLILVPFGSCVCKSRGQERHICYCKISGSSWPLFLSDINAAYLSVMAEIFVGIFKLRLSKKNCEPPDNPHDQTHECHPGNGLGWALVLAFSNPSWN